MHRAGSSCYCPPNFHDDTAPTPQTVIILCLSAHPRPQPRPLFRRPPLRAHGSIHDTFHPHSRAHHVFGTTLLPTTPRLGSLGTRGHAALSASPCHHVPSLTIPQALNKTRRKKNVKKGIQFCLMVCGASGTGRTTFVNTLCGQQVLGHKEVDDPTTAHIEEGVKIKPITVGRLPPFFLGRRRYRDALVQWLTTNRTRRGGHPYLAHHCRHTRLWRPNRQRGQVGVLQPPLTTPAHLCCSFSEIVGYLERQYDGILAEESRIKRNPRFRDDRVHVLLYFITPTGHGYVFSQC